MKSFTNADSSVVSSSVEASSIPKMPYARVPLCGDESSKAEAGEVMSGVLEIIRGSSSAVSSSRPMDNSVQRVFVRVYHTSSEQHFAVLYPVRAIVTACRPLCSLNLKSCGVKSLSGSRREFRVSSRACDGATITFRVLDGYGESHVAQWVEAFSDKHDDLHQRRKKVSNHRSSLPVLQESEEEVEEV